MKKTLFVVCVLFGTFVSISAGLSMDLDEYSSESEAEIIPGLVLPADVSIRRTTLPNSHRVSYGEECGQWTKCATQSWLSCRNGRCECFKPEEMEFHSSQGKCVAKAGERCKYIAGEMDGRSLFDSVGCVDNAACSVDGVCTCGVGLYETPDGHCAPLKEHGDDCVAHLECSKERGLWCNNGTCACNGEQGLIYEPERDECIALAKRKCRRNVGEFVCVANAFCNDMDVCECSENFYATSNDTCSPVEVYGGQCDEDAGCNRHYNLGCYGGVCGCETNRTTIIFMEHCVGQAERPCVDFDYGYKCTEFAQCVRGTCRCHPNYYRNSHGQCERTVDLSLPCTQDIQCSQEPHALKCIGGQCQCHPEVSVFARVKRAKRLGQSDRWLPGAFLGFEEGSYDDCVPLASLPCSNGLCAPGAYCNYFEKKLLSSTFCGTEEIQVGNPIGICQCQPGLSLSKSKTCVPGYNQVCSSEVSCMEGLYCKNNVCSCKLDSHSEGYNSTSQTCYSKVGGPCESHDNCEENAYCESGLCKCSNGFVTGPTRVCEAEGGGSCSSKAECDSIAGLNCVNNVCQCPGFGLYDAGLRKCLGLVGGQCESEKDCVRPATCSKEHSQLPGLCSCPSGLERNINYTCVQTL